MLLAAGAAVASAMTAPSRTSMTAPTTTVPLSTTTVPRGFCPAPAGSPTVTLSDTSPIPSITVSVNTTLVAMVPPWPDQSATDIRRVNPTVLSETCTELLSDGGRRTVLYALNTGQSLITATVTPPTETMMPAWQATVTVTGSNPLPPAGALSSVIDLPSTTLVAGTTVDGDLVVTNHTDKTINLTQGCKPFWSVGLQSPTIPYNPVEPTPCEPAPFLLAPGANRLPFELRVRYLGCSTNSESTSPSYPPCVGTEPPPLPPGSYEAVLVSQSPSLSAAPVNVEVVAGLAAPPCGVVPGPEVVITNSTQPCSVATHVGATIHIVLDAGFTWNTPTSDSSVVHVVNVQRQSSGRLDADLRAVNVGQATVSSTGSILCPSGQACPALARLWAVHITVSP